MRCFVAVDLPSEVRSAVGQIQGQLRTGAPRSDVRWADPTQIHLTLKFLGAVPDERVREVSATLERAVAGTPPIALAAGGLGGFPSLRSARVLWAGITAGTGELAALALAVERALGPLGFPLEERPFRGHLTIGRVRSPRSGRALAEAVEKAGGPAFGAWTVSEIVLYESRLRPTGALYVPVSHHRLRGAVP